MSKSIRIKVPVPKARVRVVNPKGGPMRDRRDRRPKDARRSWKGEEW